jgi:general secretion pathway protein F
MKTYAYRGYGAGGAACKGLVEAESPKAAREKLAKAGVLADRLSTGGARNAGLPPSRRGVLYRELASLLKAGMPLVTALGTLLKTPDLEPSAGVLAAVRDQVREGSSLAAALKAAVADISPFEAATIDVAERTASMEKVLDQLAVFIEVQEQLRERVQRALIYPSLVLGLGVAVAVVMLGVLVPRTQQMIGSAASLPALTSAMLLLGRILFPWGLALVPAIVLLVAGWRRRVLGDDEKRVSFNRRFFALPLVGTGYRYLVSTRFARTLGILVHSGVTLVEGVPLAGRATGSAWCERLSVKASEAIRHGQTLEAAVRAIPPFADTLPGWIAVGEASGDLSGMLEHAAERCDRRFENFLSKTLALIEPLLLLVIGAFVLLVTLAVMLPVFSLTDAVLR